MVKLMNIISKTKISPLIGSAGVSAVPMAARVSQDMGSKEDPQNVLLMHAMGPNVAGVIGSAVAAGVLLVISVRPYYLIFFLTWINIAIYGCNEALF